MDYFQYGQKEIDYLSKKDKKLAAAISRIGMIERSVNPDIFCALIQSIVGQQISTKAAVTVFDRLNTLCGGISASAISSTPTEQIQACGMSLRKAFYIKGCADASVNSDISFDTLHTLDDEQVIKKLVTLNGVGVWTAQMLLIFSLMRPDVISYDDLGIRRGLMNLYGLKTLTKKQFEVYRKRYSPYASVASIYIWQLSH